MKKHLYFAFVAAGMLCACSSSDDVVDAGGNVPGMDDNSRQEILLSVGANAQVATRGTGSVGANHNDLTTNNWENQLVNIYMFEKGTFNIATDENGQEIYNNATFLTPKGTPSGVARHMDYYVTNPNYAYETYGYKRSYYPMSGEFDFWGYRVDDAENVTVTSPGNVSFTIDGTQDILAASTKLSQEDSLKLAGITGTLDAAVTAGNVVLKEDKSGIDKFVDVDGGVAADTNFANYYASIYSAKAARKNVQPSLLFKHKLTRFTFDAKPMLAEYASNGENPIRIRKIVVYSKADGTLEASYDANDFIQTALTSKGEATTPLILKKRSKATDATQNTKLVELTEEIEDYNKEYPLNTEEKDADGASVTQRTEEGIDLDVDKYKEIGEAVMVIPGEEEYLMDIELEQTVASRENVNGDGIEDSKKIYVKTIEGLAIKRSDVVKDETTGEGADAVTTTKPETSSKTFDEGKSYNVRVQVYGLTQIKITTTLEPWEDGGYIEIDPDNNKPSVDEGGTDEP